MRKQVVIELEEPVTIHDGALTSITLREPNASAVFEIGEPQIASYDSGGGLIVLDRVEALQSYFELLLVDVKPVDAAAIYGQMSLADGLAVKEAIIGFFAEARRKNSARSRPSSSGNSGSSPGATSSA